MSWLRALLSDFIPAIQTILAEATSGWKWRLAEGSALLPSRMGESGKVVLIGDSCHAMVPFAGQGAAQCIEDAAVVSELLSSQPSSSIHDDKDIIPKLAKLYEEIRRSRCRTGSTITRWRMARTIPCRTVRIRRGEMKYSRHLLTRPFGLVILGVLDRQVSQKRLLSCEAVNGF